VRRSNADHIVLFDPNSYQVVPASSDDVPLYTQFTSLKHAGLQTWMAIGGFDFSDNGTATHTAWYGPASPCSFEMRNMLTSTKEHDGFDSGKSCDFYQRSDVLHAPVRISGNRPR
jgi:hypothetical protein